MRGDLLDLKKIYSSKRFLITGAAGFIGFHLAKRLLEHGAFVVGYDNLNDYYDLNLKENRLSILDEYPCFRFIRGDLSDEETLKALFMDVKPAIVINLAAQAGVRHSIDHPRVYIDSNIVGFFNILEMCRYNRVEHMVFASSSSVYGNQKKVPFAITDRVDQPISLYAATKKTNELMAYTYSHLYGIPTTGLRFFTVYGPYGRPDMAYFKFADLITKGKPIKVYNNGDMLRDFTYIDDIVSGVEHVIFSLPQSDEIGTRYKIYNIGNNKPVKLLDFITMLEEALGKKAIKEYLPMQLGDVYQTYADISELEKNFAFRPKIDLAEGLRRFAKWYKEYLRHAR